VAAGRQPEGYNSIRDTISSLAARGATDRWVMTAALLGVGASYITSGAALRSSRPVGRGLLACGGAATMLVAAFPQPARGNSVAHTVAAATAFLALAAWPLGGSTRGSAQPLLSRTAGTAVTIATLALLLWFTLEIHGSYRGLAERAAALAEATWPLAVALSVRRRTPVSGFVHVV
jgi:hypothetical membrane protein